MLGIQNPITSMRTLLTQNCINPALETFRAIKNTVIEHSGELAGQVRDQFNQTCSSAKIYAEREIAPRLPQKNGAARIARLEQRITSLEDTSNRETFTAEAQREISEQKTTLITEYMSICGRYCQDPASSAHIASQAFKALELAYNATAATPFDRTLEEPSSEEMRPVFEAYKTFTDLKQRSEAILQELRELGSIFKSDPELLTALQAEKLELKQFQRALCGAHKADASSQLHKAWSEYKKSIPVNDPIASAALLDIYNNFEVQRKTVNARLLLINRMLTAATGPTLDSIITQKIEAVVTPIRTRIELERSNVGIDWKSTAVHTTTALMPLIAYAVAPTAIGETNLTELVIL